MHFAPWYRREEYALIREIMDDGKETFPLSFDEWERNAESERASAKLEGTILIPVVIAPDEFFSFCNKWKIPLNKTRIRQQSRGSQLLHGDVRVTFISRTLPAALAHEARVISSYIEGCGYDLRQR